VLARNRYIDEADLLKMLSGISNKIVHSTNHVYIHGEDERLASTVQEILRRDILTLDKVEDWIKFLIEPNGRSWKGAYVEEARNRAFQNMRNLLRSIHLALITQPGEFHNRERITGLLLGYLQALRPY
jgi:hypothetical protein